MPTAALFAAPIAVDPAELALLRRKVAAADLFVELLALRRQAGRTVTPARELAYLRAILEES
ncbi:MAG: hypothetical protein H0X35_11605 [Pseudonocardiales bacterium]|nr:hypothetical protein [Pseudonocardiales bacterium]